MNIIVLSILSVTILGIACAVMLSIAAKFMSVKVDERIPQVRECLPGANCGACGFAGCDGYAAALVDDEELALTLCTPGGADAASAIAQVLGRDAGDVAKLVAVVKCRGGCEAAPDKTEYEGIESCSAAKLLFGGPKACTFGCIGLGECAVVCPQDAICIEDGIAHVDTRKCIGCGLCVKACPNNIIAMQKEDAPITVMCNSNDKGAAVRKKCSVGCIGCGMCMKKCPSEAITVKNFLAEIDYDKCIGCKACKEVCPAKCII